MIRYSASGLRVAMNSDSSGSDFDEGLESGTDDNVGEAVQADELSEQHKE